MAIAAGASAKQLRWQLLDMFPQASMKLIAEAAKCGDLHTALDIITAGTAPEEPMRSLATSHAPCLPEEPSDAIATDTPTIDTTSAAPHLQKVALQVLENSTAAQEQTSPSHGGVKKERPPDSTEETEDGKPEVHDELFTFIDDTPNTTHVDAHLPSNVRKTADGWEIRFEADLLRPCQSLRTKSIPGNDVVRTVLDQCGSDNTAAFASICFEQMMRREQELEGEFCVFYHSYNSAALIYEIQAEIARYAFGMDDKFAPLPRIVQSHFTGVTIDDLRNSEGAKHQDCLPSFRKLAICASPTIFAFGSEAPPLNCFRYGYGIHAPLSQLTRDLLSEATGLPEKQFALFMSQLADLATKFGLRPYDAATGSSPGPNRLGGHMLQIFIHRNEVDHMVYNSLPFGVPIPTDSVDQWLAGKDKLHEVDGQVRILMRPEVFLDSTRGRIFHYCGDWEFHGGTPDMEGSRAAFVQELRSILQPFLSQVRPVDMRLRLTGETDANRSRRVKSEIVAMKRESRLAAKSSRAAIAAAAKTSAAVASMKSSSNTSSAGTSSKKRGKKH